MSGTRLLFTSCPLFTNRRANTWTTLPYVLLASQRRYGATSLTRMSANSNRALVIVESPAKARTIAKYLPEEQYEVRSCVGHIRELPSSAKRIPAKFKALPWAKLGVNIEDDFRPLYVLIEGKSKLISELRTQLADKRELILATDDDREGEAISWHLLEVLKPQVPVRRAVFHEITHDAVQSGLDSTRDLDMNLVQAQETRRVLDRLVGYTMSPLLWKKIARGLSAGRVQSVAMAQLVRREYARLRFIPSQYLSCAATLSSVKSDDDSVVSANLAAVDGIRLARGADFDGETGNLRDDLKSGSLHNFAPETLRDLVSRATDKTATVSAVERRSASRNPQLPLITSTLQQECGNKLGMGAGRTMRAAQRLYENGYITYMRTDNPVMSEAAVTAARDAIISDFGKEFVNKELGKPLKKPKAAQAAHEAIRPAGNSFKKPGDTDLEGDELKVYDLIYRRTLASQMTPAKVDTTKVSFDISVEDPHGELRMLTFRATGSIIVFPGFLAVMKGDASSEKSTQFLPEIEKGSSFTFNQIDVIEHSTKPPARYNDASLVKNLEELGVGRPSTYAAIIEKLIDRGYAFRGKALGEHKGVSAQSLVPSLSAFAVERLLSEHFSDFVDAQFTARMEATLDDIAAGAADRSAYLADYYSGESGLAASVARTEADIDPAEFRRICLPNLPTGMCDKVPTSKKGRSRTASSSPTPSKSKDWSTTRLLVNSYGPYIERDGSVIASLPKTTLADELNEAHLEQLIKIARDPPVLGRHPETDQVVVLKTSRYGPYVQLGRDEEYAEGEKPKRAGLLRGMTVEELDVATAVKLLSLPRDLGLDPRSKASVTVHQGPFGPYIACDGVTVALRGEPSRVLTVELDECVELLEAARERREKREERQAAKTAAAAAAETSPAATNTTKDKVGDNSTKKRSVKGSQTKGTSEGGKVEKKKATSSATKKKSKMKDTEKVTADEKSSFLRAS